MTVASYKRGRRRIETPTKSCLIETGYAQLDFGRCNTGRRGVTQSATRGVTHDYLIGFKRLILLVGAAGFEPATP